MSDSHDHYENLNKAVEMVNDEGCEILLFAGDLIAPGNGSEALSKFNGPVKMIYGNNDGDPHALNMMFSKYDNLEIVGKEYEAEVEGVKIFMTHYPRIGQLAAKSGEFDLVIYGHDHTYNEENVGETILLNPGAIHPYKIEYASFVIFDTESKSIEKIVL